MTEPKYAVLKQEHSSLLSVIHTRNKVELIPSAKAKNAVENIQLVPDEVDTHSSGDDLNEENMLESKIEEHEHAGSKNDQNDPIADTIPSGIGSEDWNTLKSEVKFRISEASTRTTLSFQNVALPNIFSYLGKECIEIAFAGDSELDYWIRLKSEVKSTTEEAFTRATSLQNATQANISSLQKRDDVVTYGSANGLDGNQEELKKMDNNETSWSRGTE